MNFQIKDYLKFSGISAIIAVCFSTVSMLLKTIILIRMNAQACIPETSLYEYYRIDYQLIRLICFTVAGFILPFIFDTLSLLPKPIIVLPKWFSKIIDYTLTSIFVITIIVGLGLVIWIVFIKTPC